MVDPQVVLVNQFGEKTNNYIPGGSNIDLATPIDAQKLVGNLSGSSALPAALALQTVANKLPAKAGVTSISALGTTVSAITTTLSTSNTYSDAAVKSAVDTALVSVVADLQALQTQLNLVLAQLKVVS